MFEKHLLCYATIECDMKTIEERKIIRGDRSIILTREQMPKIKKINSYRKEDLKVNISNKSPFEKAKLILVFFDKKV
ncbi:MAG: hypothetical protein mread185_000641 [Mycoplasmataceae bacterium]|nr:MAG: hypothetical protein mread185_000641 [Mycoplasmataceae bacterium]